MNEINVPNALLSRLTTVATLAAQKTGEYLKKGFRSHFNVEIKEGRHNLVTEIDLRAEDLIIEFISGFFPDHSFLGEEKGAIIKDENAIQWIVDPLDGTLNFIHKVPVFTVSIAATFRGEVLCGVVFQPMTGEFFIAEKGKGAYLNGDRLQVSTTSLLENAYAATGFPYNLHEDPYHCIEVFSNFAKMGTPIRRMGSAVLDLAYLAAGRFDIYWNVHLKPWDYAAGKILVEEAGGKLTTFHSEPYNELIEGPVAASNGILHEQLIGGLSIHNDQNT